MKLILSRKGFDSSAGGCANPILPDGRLLSLPIPDPAAPFSYGAIRSPAGKLGSIVSSLTRGKVKPSHKAHLDPDLDREALDRDPAWRPTFGQMGAAQGHLRKQGVGLGDLFLFFGWFRQTERVKGKLAFVKDAPDQHILFGWFQIGAIRDLAQDFPDEGHWQRSHPHCFGERGGGNTLYVAAKDLSLPGLTRTLPGAGLYPAVRPELILTQPQQRRGIWRLPHWFNYKGPDHSLSYHGASWRWQEATDHVVLDSAKRGQEFVLDDTHYPEAVAWARGLIETGAI